MVLKFINKSNFDIAYCPKSWKIRSIKLGLLQSLSMLLMLMFDDS